MAELDWRRICRVCGTFYPDYFPWGETGQDPSRDICDCCGIEWGYQDCTASAIRTFRANWIAEGAVWFDPKQKPESWNLERQLEQIPVQFR